MPCSGLIMIEKKGERQRRAILILYHFRVSDISSLLKPLTSSALLYHPLHVDTFSSKYLLISVEKFVCLPLDNTE